METFKKSSSVEDLSVLPAPHPQENRGPNGMDHLHIQGGQALNGTIPVSGAKNAALPLMCASLLTEEAIQLTNVPVGLGDIRAMTGLLRALGVRAALREDGLAVLQAHRITDHTAPYDIVRKMRASVLVLGPLLARHGRAEVSLPGGCAIGTRPVDLHLKGLEALGAIVNLEDGYVKAEAPAGGLHGAAFHLDFPSVGATENLMMAACLANGETVLSGVAQEPEITDLGECLIGMGARIEGLGTPEIRIQGVSTLKSTVHEVIPDRVEAGTWMIAAAMTGGNLRLQNARLHDLQVLADVLTEAGADIRQDSADILVSRTGGRLKSVDITTAPHPGFPTDLQAQFMAMLTLCEGEGTVTETIFENRFMHVPELMRLGADIQIQGNKAVVRGVPSLKGAPVMATDLRASVALVLAGLAAEGETTIGRLYHLDRGYENIVEKLQGVGANVGRKGGD